MSFAGLMLAGMFSMSSAQAAPEGAAITAREAIEMPGVSVFEISREGSCPSHTQWNDEAVMSTLSDEVSGRLIKLDLAKNAVEIRQLLDGGRRYLPMQIAYVDGQEVDRVCGCLSSDLMQSWIKGLPSKQTLVSYQTDQFGPRDESPINLENTMELVRYDRCANRLSDAMSHLVWLWVEIPQRAPELGPQRLSVVADEMSVLAQTDEKAGDMVRSLRDVAQLRREKSRDDLVTWLALNEILNNNQVSFDWFEMSRNDPSKAELVEAARPAMYFHYRDEKRWKEAGSVIEGNIGSWLSLWLDAENPYKAVGQGYTALLAAERSSDARYVEKQILELRGGRGACDLLSFSVGEGVAESGQKKLVKQCERTDVVLAWQRALGI